MKKILPILVLTSGGLLLTGCSANMNTGKLDITDNVQLFTESVNEYFNLNEQKATTTVLNKYAVSIEEDLPLDLPDTIEYQEDSTIPQENDTTLADTTQEIDTEADLIEEVPFTNYSTLYSLSSDIEDSCNEFCQLKEQISNAILETEAMINKLKNNEIELTNEQKMFITEQSCQLKNLGRQLSKITNQLSYELSDLPQLMATTDNDLLSLKYLVILDNLMNGNEMLNNSLASLNMMNQIANINYMNMLNNNRARILYGFQKNNEEPIIHDLYIDENGKITENNNDSINNETENNNDENKSIDTYTNSNLESNIDTYGNNMRNIDTFFNTALLNNEFMYGNGYNGYGMNPYLNPYSMYTNNNQVMQNNYNNHEKLENFSQNDQKTSKNDEKRSKKFKLTKNIDTYRDENTPKLKDRINSVKGFFSKFSRPKDNLQNPIYRYDIESDQEN